MNKRPRTYAVRIREDAFKLANELLKKQKEQGRKVAISDVLVEALRKVAQRTARGIGDENEVIPWSDREVDAVRKLLALMRKRRRSRTSMLRVLNDVLDAFDKCD